MFEGVLLRDDERWIVAVRAPGGEILTDGGDVPGRSAAAGVPFLRGLVALRQALPLGYRALRWSAVHGLGQVERRATPAERLTAILLTAVVAAVVVGGPPAFARAVAGADVVAANVAEALAGLALLVAYVAAIGRRREVGRLFEYHGAEHQVVAAHEAGVEVTPATAAAFPTTHVRCGTSFLLCIGAVSAVVYTVLGRHDLPTTIALRVGAVPAVAAVAAELQLLAGANVHRRWVRALLAPGLALQRLTTRPPSPAQLQVAAAALAALTAEERRPAPVG